MKTLFSTLTLCTAFSLAAEPGSLANLVIQHAQQRKALRERQKQENLKLIEQQLAELEKLAAQEDGKNAKRVRVEIDRLLKSADAGQRLTAALFAEAIDPKNPGAIKALISTPEKLVVTEKDAGGKWARMPEILLGATIYTGDWKRSNGVADFKATRNGRVFLALNYDYQGNGSGGWTEERLLAGQFMARGWARVSGAELVAWNNRTYQVFTRVCKKGEQFRLRCNKYEPPYVIVLDGGKAVEKADLLENIGGGR